MPSANFSARLFYQGHFLPCSLTPQHIKGHYLPRLEGGEGFLQIFQPFILSGSLFTLRPYSQY
jgi:hypothetical protein